MQSTDSSTDRGGAAPAARQCQFTKSDGFRCRDWALRGHQHCFRHHQYLHSRPENPIDVPLLEDEDSLASLLSQTLRALAWGTIPAANGRAILAGCRIMQGILTHRLATARFHVKCRSLGMTDAEDELFDRQPSIEPEAEPEPEPETEPQAEPAPVPSTPSPVACNPSPRFPNLRKEWDDDLRRAEEEMMKVRFPDPDQKPAPFRVSRAVSFTVPTVEELVAAHASRSGSPAY